MKFNPREAAHWRGRMGFSGLAGICRSLFLVLVASQAAKALVSQSEGESLLLFRSTLIDSARVLENWGEVYNDGPIYAISDLEDITKRRTDPCYPPSPWRGVSCSNDTDGRLTVTELRLSGFSTSGSISTELAPLRNSSSLVLSRNSFSGKIPDNLFELQNLLMLDLGDNQLIGPIPQLPPQLFALDLRNNLFGGDINLTGVFNTCQYIQYLPIRGSLWQSLHR